jgi:hypothetical protein
LTPLSIIGLVVVALGHASPVSSSEEPTDWGRDVLVGRTGTIPTAGKLVSDADTNGDIYVGVLDPGPGFEDTLQVWSSTDAGFSWNTCYRATGDSIHGGIRDCELRVGHDANGAWLYDFVVFDGADSEGLWLLRRRPGTSEPTWTRIVGGDTLLRVAADRNIESPEHLFVAWETQGGLVNLMSSTDSGETWGNLKTALTESERPSLCAGGGGCVYVAANTRDSAWVWVKRYTGNLAGSDTALAKLDSSSNRRAWNVSVAADRESPCSLQTAIVLYSHRDSIGRIAPHFGWTTTGGEVWSYFVWPPTNQTRTTWDARFPNVRRSYDDALIRAIVTMHEPSRNWDTLVYAFARPGSPADWEQRAVRNELRATDEFGAKVGYSRASMGGYVAYVRYNTGEVYFDGYSFVGAQEPRHGPHRPVSPTTILGGARWACQLTLDRRSFVRATLYDGTGRRIRGVLSRVVDAGTSTIWIPTAALPASRYYLIVRTPDHLQTYGLTRVR